MQTYYSRFHSEWIIKAVYYSFFKDFIYLFLDRGEGREKERERNVSVWSPLERTPPRIWPATQACALPRNRTSDPLVCSPALNPLSHTIQSWTLKLHFQMQSNLSDKVDLAEYLGKILDTLASTQFFQINLNAKPFLLDLSLPLV